MTEVKLKLRTPQEVYDYLIEGEDDAMVITKLTTLHFAYQREIERLDKSGRIYAATITDLREEIRQLRLTLTDWNRANVEMSDEVDRLRRALLDRDQRLDAALGKLSGERR